MSQPARSSPWWRGSEVERRVDKEARRIGRERADKVLLALHWQRRRPSGAQRAKLAHYAEPSLTLPLSIAIDAVVIQHSEDHGLQPGTSGRRALLAHAHGVAREEMLRRMDEVLDGPRRVEPARRAARLSDVLRARGPGSTRPPRPG